MRSTFSAHTTQFGFMNVIGPILGTTESYEVVDYAIFSPFSVLPASWDKYSGIFLPNGLRLN
jgi:hypothetical protein